MLGLVVGGLLHDLAVDLVLEALELVAVAQHRQGTVHLVLILQQLQVTHVPAHIFVSTVLYSESCRYSKGFVPFKWVVLLLFMASGRSLLLFRDLKYCTMFL